MNAPQSGASVPDDCKPQVLVSGGSRHWGYVCNLCGRREYGLTSTIESALAFADLHHVETHASADEAGESRG